MAEQEAEVLSHIYNGTFFLSSELFNSYRRKENILFSPLVLQTFLSSLSRDYRRRSRSYLQSLLCYNNQKVYVKCYKEFISFIYSISKDNLNLESKLFVSDNLTLQDDYKNLVKNFNYEIESIDFSKNENSAKLIDSWVHSKIGGLENLISSDKLSEETRLALLNALHVKAKWNIPFVLAPNPFLFHVNEDCSIETPMMEITADVCYTFESSFKAIELPFTSQDLCLLVILPNKGYKTSDLNIWSCLNIITTNAMHKEIEVTLPKFKIEDLLDCKNISSDLNLTEEFEHDILENEEFLKYDEMDQKMFISVDENGVEARSGLAVTMVPVNLEEQIASSDGLKISEMSIKTNISNRFAKTLVTCKMQNEDASAREANFNVILPDAAFITEFVMEIGGQSYKSYIKGKGEAKNIYNEAVAVGNSAGIVEADTRNSNQFDVSVNLEPHSIAVFLLTYEEMLQRFHDQYELVLNICPGRLVDNLNVEVNINESSPIRFVKTPPLRSGKEHNPKIEKYLVPSSDIKMINSNSSIVKYNANIKEQLKFSWYLDTPFSEGFSGQFVVQYDVERDPTDGEILLQDGYFVHFFAPNDLEPLPKHMVFVLDTSTSMMGRKIHQLKDAMMSILNDIREGDMISIIEFNEDIIIWDITSETPKTITNNQFNNFRKPFQILAKLSFPSPTIANDAILSKAKNVVQKMEARGSTFMIGGLEVALYLVNVGQTKIVEENTKYQPIMVFLTDGQPNVGSSSPPHIVQTVTGLNSEYNKVPIFSLSFGEGADKSFLRELSLKNFGFSRHIYDASDASLQLQSFYKQISSPLLKDIKFKYESDVTEVTRSHFPIYFSGSELVVSGLYKGSGLPNTINGCGPRGCLNLESIIQNPVTSLERLWAYLTVKQLLEERNIADNKEELTKRATDLALKYSFVTELTSLVAVKPSVRDDTNSAPAGVCVEELPEDITVVENIEDNLDIKDGRPKKKIIKKRCIKKQKARKDEPVEIIEVEEDAVGTSGDVEKNEPEKLKFVADHPFLVALILKREDKRIILFTGMVSRPLC